MDVKVGGRWSPMPLNVRDPRSLVGIYYKGPRRNPLQDAEGRTRPPAIPERGEPSNLGLENIVIGQEHRLVLGLDGRPYRPYREVNAEHFDSSRGFVSRPGASLFSSMEVGKSAPSVVGPLK